MPRRQNLKRWVIIAAGDEDLERDRLEILYWNNESGWVTDIAQAFIVEDDEKALCALPMGGKWLDITKETK